MDDYANPLARFGVPKWLVEEALGVVDGKSVDTETREAALKEIQGAAQAVYRRLSRIYHPDTGTRPDSDKFAALADEVSQLDDLDVVEVFARDLVDTGSIYAERARALAARNARQSHDRYHALLGMLSAVSPFIVLGSEQPVELLLGLPASFSDGITGMFTQTFFLQPGVEQSPLSVGPHPMEEDHINTAAFDVSYPIYWDDGAWRVDYYDVDSESRRLPKVHRYTPEPFGQARLVGGVSGHDMFMLGARLRSAIDADQRQITGAKSGAAVKGLSWYPADRAWWLSHMRPTLGLGDYAVLARGTGNGLTLAVGGMFVKWRPLDATQ